MRSGPGILERNITALAAIFEHATFADTAAQRDGFLQRLDPRAKILGLGAWTVATVGTHSLGVIVATGLAGAGLAVASGIPLPQLAGRVWLGVLFFTGVIVFPALFLTPGPTVATVPGLGWPITASGLRTAVLLVARAETTATLSMILVFSTPWVRVLKALRVLRMPVVLVVILGMTHRYIFLLLRVAQDYFLARRTRMVGPLCGAQRRQIIAGTAGVLLGKSLGLSEEVYQAMQSRGFQGEVYTLDEFCWQRRDGLALAGFVGFALLACWFGLQ